MVCVSVTEGVDVEVIFLSPDETMVMDPRGDKHGQQSITVPMVEERKSAAVEEVVASESVSKGAAV